MPNASNEDKPPDVLPKRKKRKENKPPDDRARSLKLKKTVEIINQNLITEDRIVLHSVSLNLGSNI